jgi:hypothetical protein
VQLPRPVKGEELEWRLKSGSNLLHYGYDLVDEGGLSRATSRQSVVGTLKEVSIGGRNLLLKRRPEKSRFDVHDRATGNLVASANWAKQTMQVEDRPPLCRTHRKAPPP